MGLSAKVTTFRILSTDTAGTNYDVTLGFQPKFYILSWNGVDAGASPASTLEGASVCMGHGWGDSAATPNRQCYFGQTRDGFTNSEADEGYADTMIVGWQADGSGAIVGALDVAAVSSWPADGIRFTVDDQFPSTLTVTVWAIGGTDITSVNLAPAFETATAGQTGNVDYGVATGVEPDAVFFLAGNTTGLINPSGTGSDFPLCIGFATDQPGSVKQACIASFAEATASPTTTDGYISVSSCVTMHNSTGATYDKDGAYVGKKTGGGFTLNWVTAGNDSYKFLWCIIKGGKWDCPNAQTSVTGSATVSVTGMSFAPSAGIVLSTCRATSTFETGSTPAQQSVGFFTGAAERAMHGYFDENNVTTTEVVRTFKPDAVYRRCKTGTASGGIMDVDAMLSDGVRFIMDEADDTASRFAVVLVGPTTPGASPPTLRWQRRKGW